MWLTRHIVLSFSISSAIVYISCVAWHGMACHAVTSYISKIVTPTKPNKKNLKPRRKGKKEEGQQITFILWYRTMTLFAVAVSAFGLVGGKTLSISFYTRYRLHTRYFTKQFYCPSGKMVISYIITVVRMIWDS